VLSYNNIVRHEGGDTEGCDCALDCWRDRSQLYGGVRGVVASVATVEMFFFTVKTLDKRVNVPTQVGLLIRG